MTRIKQLAVSSLAAGALAAGLFAAAPAQAATPADTQAFCPFPDGTTVFLPDGTSEFGVEANGAGCVVVHVLDGGFHLMIAQLVVAPGWTAEVKDGQQSTDDRVRVRFTETATGDRVEVRVEPGKTEVK